MRRETADAFAEWQADIQEHAKVHDPKSITAREFALQIGAQHSKAKDLLEKMVEAGKATRTWKRVGHVWAVGYRKITK